MQHPLLHWGSSSTGSPVVQMVQQVASDTDLLASQSMTSCHESVAEWRKQQPHNHQDVNAWHKSIGMIEKYIYQALCIYVNH